MSARDLVDVQLVDVFESLGRFAGEADAVARGLREFADDLERPIAPRLELGDLLQREFRLDLTSAAARLLLDSVIEEITTIVVEPYVEAAAELATRVEALIENDVDDVAENFVCLDCGASTLELREYYMLENPVWLEANPADDGMLCIGCVEERLGRRLRPDDFMPIEMNRSERHSERLSARILGLDETSAG